jgi:hypothetical protein
LSNHILFSFYNFSYGVYQEAEKSYPNVWIVANILCGITGGVFLIYPLKILKQDENMCHTPGVVEYIIGDLMDVIGVVNRRIIYLFIYLFIYFLWHYYME